MTPAAPATAPPRRLPRRALAAIAAAAALLAGCAQPAREARMAVAAPPAPVVAPTAPLHRAVAVGEVAGGRPTSPLWLSQVDNPALAHALQRSLQSSAMLALDDPERRYVVDARLVALRQPWFSIDTAVSTRVAYRVTERRSGAVVHEDDLTTAHTVPFEAAPLGPERLRLASEGAVRENIGLFLQRFAERAPPGPPPRPLARLELDTTQDR